MSEYKYKLIPICSFNGVLDEIMVEDEDGVRHECDDSQLVTAETREIKKLLLENKKLKKLIEEARLL